MRVQKADKKAAARLIFRLSTKSLPQIKQLKTLTKQEYKSKLFSFSAH
ncbi:hypothetical protein ACXG8O_001430 [Citrobacter youngae]